MSRLNSLERRDLGEYPADFAPLRTLPRCARLARAARDRRIIGGAAATAGAALAAGVARELMADDDGEGTDSAGAYRIKNSESASAAVIRIARGRLDRALEPLERASHRRLDGRRPR